jgi:peptidoglycan/xylan/chitin deacetylase (PgdA/CDA1 family)
MRSVVAAAGAALLFASTAASAECPANALGTARTLMVDANQHGPIGLMQYAETLPLADKEVVLTFDDGPLPPYSNRVLDILAAECVKATFFIVGQQANQFPELVRRAYDEGHTIATHTQNHPLHFNRLPAERAVAQIQDGIASTAAALGEGREVAPFFRVPGLRTSSAIEHYLTAHAVMLWSADFNADDWRHIPAKQVLKRALERLEQKHKGVLLLHDIQPATALALPDLLKELKARGYRIVHVVPTEHPTSVKAPTPATEPPAHHVEGQPLPTLSAAAIGVWPRTLVLPSRPQAVTPEPASADVTHAIGPMPVGDGHSALPGPSGAPLSAVGLP